MTCIVLAAGYATRLYPLTENFPKPLLKVKGKAILDWLLDDIDSTGFVDRFVVVTNHRYISHFQEWALHKRLTSAIDVLDDGSISNDTRLGAVMDVQFAVDTLKLDDDLLIIAGDNLLDFSLIDFMCYSKQKMTSCVMRYYEYDLERLPQMGVAQVNEQDRITLMVEKSKVFVSNWATPAFYFICRDDVHFILEAIENGCGTDTPGSFIAWLSNAAPVHAMLMPGIRYDIGTIENYRTAVDKYPGILKN